jgi:hypothetical protein
MASIEGLGRLFNIGNAIQPVDINTSDAATGIRVAMSGCTGITFVLITNAGGADDFTCDVQQHTAYTGGTSNDMDSTNGATGVDHFYIKAETTNDGDEAWVKITQTAASECVISGATYGAMQKLVAIYIPADSLADGYTHVSVNLACTTSTAQLVAGIYILHDLAVQRAPVNLPNLLRPGVANA